MSQLGIGKERDVEKSTKRSLFIRLMMKKKKKHVSIIETHVRVEYIYNVHNGISFLFNFISFSYMFQKEGFDSCINCCMFLIFVQQVSYYTAQM